MAGNGPLTFIKKAWLPLLIVVVVAVAGIIVARIQDLLRRRAASRSPPRNFADDPEPFNPKVVKYEIFGTGQPRRHQLPRSRRASRSAPTARRCRGR